MKRKAVLFLVMLLSAGCVSRLTHVHPSSTVHSLVESQLIEQTLGLSGTTTDGVLKVTKPRQDLPIMVDGFPITPRMGLTAWMAFVPHGNQTMLMGDLPLAEDELQPVLSTLMAHGLEVSALHNHFLGDEPPVMFLHVGGMADAATLARGLRATWDVIERLRQQKPLPRQAAAPTTTFDPAKLESILGVKGDLKDGVFKVTMPRPNVQLLEHGVPITSAMGFNSWAAFQGTEDRAAVSGDFAMLASEVTGVIRELRAANIDVVALHNHMLEEAPRIFFVHFWGVGRADDLTSGLRRALNLMDQR
ncbi:MAG: DUF1259 domain-containing protein [Nitrospinae bacterium]|nr:DUF1259 domain-containing protein [Nitrospinota bacterium]